MPTLPLYDPAPANPHDWHRVAAPGGYEWWRFEAADDARGLRLTVELFDGDPFDPSYARAYRRYRRRPTRVAPPLPRQFPRARLVLVENGRVRWHADPRLPAGAFRAAAAPASVPCADSGDDRAPAAADDAGAAVRVGPWAFRRVLEGGGGARFILTATKLPVALPAEARDVRITFAARDPGPPELRHFEAGERSAADHWLLAPSPYDVTATFRQPAGTPDAPGGFGNLTLEGAGRFDHFYGSGPMGDELRRRVKTIKL